LKKKKKKKKCRRNALNPWFSSKLGVGRAAGNGTL
jgi:hypothetical protein